MPTFSGKFIKEKVGEKDLKASSLETSSYDRGAQINRNVSYMIPYDLGVTFGTIYENFMKWIKK